jgi:predicted double-glycine peptidase
MRFRVWLEQHKPKILIPIQTAKQSHDYDCGSAALRAICEYYKVGPEDQAEFIKACDTGKEKGTHPEDLVKAARSFGLNAGIAHNMNLEQLFHLLDQEIPVICAVQAWGNKHDYHKLDDGHYVVAIGYDDENVYFEDPSMKASRGYIPFQEFMRRWNDIEYGKDKTEHHLGIAVWQNKNDVDAEPMKQAKKIP